MRSLAKLLHPCHRKTGLLFEFYFSLLEVMEDRLKIGFSKSDLQWPFSPALPLHVRLYTYNTTETAGCPTQATTPLRAGCAPHSCGASPAPSSASASVLTTSQRSSFPLWKLCVSQESLQNLPPSNLTPKFPCLFLQAHISSRWLFR